MKRKASAFCNAPGQIYDEKRSERPLTESVALLLSSKNATKKQSRDQEQNQMQLLALLNKYLIYPASKASHSKFTTCRYRHGDRDHKVFFIFIFLHMFAYNKSFDLFITFFHYFKKLLILL